MLVILAIVSVIIVIVHHYACGLIKAYHAYIAIVSKPFRFNGCTSTDIQELVLLRKLATRFQHGGDKGDKAYFDLRGRVIQSYLNRPLRFKLDMIADCDKLHADHAKWLQSRHDWRRVIISGSMMK